MNIESWPVDENGPLVKISIAVSELVPTGNYANVTIGPAQATKFVPNASKEDLVKEFEALSEIVEESLGSRRAAILEELGLS